MIYRIETYTEETENLTDLSTINKMLLGIL